MPRKNPYSGKQKKQQLKEKKARKQDGPKYLTEWSDDDENKSSSNKEAGLEEGTTEAAVNVKETDVQKINAQPEGRSKSSINSFRLHFLKESDEVIEKRKREARRPIKLESENESECSLQDAYPSHIQLDFPKRPPWDYNLSKSQLEKQEKSYFQGYLSEMMSQLHSGDLSYFDLNLENWRQLWRVLEISDILLIIADIRYPVLHVSPALVHHVQQALHKPVIIILNKLDFVSPELAVAWKRYLQSQFPGVYVVFFSSFVKQRTDEQPEFNMSKEVFHKPKKGSTFCFGPADLYKAVCDIVKDKVDLSSWRGLLKEEGMLSSENETGPDSDDSCIAAGDDATVEEKETDTSVIRSLLADGVVTIGCIGYPNVGKSSVLNSLKGMKVVSVSQAPGHTKHLQTIFLSPTVKLCDCPGLVFPSVVPKALQVIAGIFPVAQVREPYSSIQYLAERINLPALLRIRHPNRGSPEDEKDWSAYDICEAYAIKCGFLTSKAARPDFYRAANKILRMAVTGQLCLCLQPPEYALKKDDFKSDAETLNLHARLIKAGFQAALLQRGAGVTDDGDDDYDDDENDMESSDDEDEDSVESI